MDESRLTFEGFKEALISAIKGDCPASIHGGINEYLEREAEAVKIAFEEYAECKLPRKTPWVSPCFNCLVDEYEG